MADFGSTLNTVLDKNLALIVGLAIYAAFIPLMFTQLGTIVTNFTGVNTGSATLDSLIIILAIPVGVTLVLGIYKGIRLLVGD